MGEVASDLYHRVGEENQISKVLDWYYVLNINEEY